jgi:hypothetical protein
MTLNELRALNPHLDIKGVTNLAFKKYGRIITGYDFTELIKYMQDNTEIPEVGNIYSSSEADMEAEQISKDIEKNIFGEIPIQVGYYNGISSTLDALEYHKSSELNIAVTDMLLFLGRVQDMVEWQYDVENLDAFFIPAGVAVELYATTLHFSPCRIEPSGFKCIVVLPKGTNHPLEHEYDKQGENKLLFMKNKWLIVHPSRESLLHRGAHLGINGANLKIFID